VKISENLVEQGCIDQIQEMIDHEAFVAPKNKDNVAIMPDTHYGAGAVIGFTMPLKNRVCPNTIGVDIGCGMYAANLSDADLDDLKALDEEDMEKQTEGVYMSKIPIDEIPTAYKNPRIVEDAIGETAEIIDRIKPVLSIKAD